MTERNDEIDVQVMELENTDIIGIVRENGVTPEQLAELIRSLKTNIMPKEEEQHE